ncbi:MAG: hypothetical protein HN390_15645 [Anaerolineae bacterium]|jgi:hypothetical protein|nr:hypothetical protein [Anaerolineae bacterium]MBT7188736.1 hypothetical protein [Anaerolineae bacterium]MBT7600217.1 hypothetical protein [Anaerolineae bacterium]MBT7991245.1 hypothetical protein [Anaerolineae bacterium]
MQKKNEAVDRAALDDAIVQCLRLFAQHGRQIRQERKAQIKTRDHCTEKGKVEVISEAK